VGTDGGGPFCAGCGLSKINRPRGLCWHCYYTPGVRARFARGSANPATAKYVTHGPEPTAEEVEAMVAEQLPTMPTGGPGEAPKPPPRESRGTLADRRVERTWREWDVPPAWSLHPDTSPAAIAATHRAIVAEAVRELGPGATAEAISEATCLPTWNVTRHLGEVQ
jgi:hypothetical protein